MPDPNRYMNQGTVLTSAYLPPVQYITKFLTNRVLIERHENYQKQSYRNRCCISGANGLQCLVIPVKKNHNEKTPVTEIEIDYATNWQHNHLKAIESAYRLSAFYEFYADELRDVICSHHVLLYDLNMQLLRMVLQWLNLKAVPAETDHWQQEYTNDFRTIISPKDRLYCPDHDFKPVPYQQVFMDRHGFLPNLSIIDLLFNEGPQALLILKSCTV